jgi:hypothetical protein
MMLCLRGAGRRPDSDEGADVELDGSHGLHGGRQPVDPAGLEDEDLAVGRTRSPGCGIDRLAVLQEAGRGEEQRPDEERHRVGPRAHGVRVRGHRAQREEERADGEQHPHPPVTIARRPPRRAAWRGSVQVLAVRARFPVRDHAVRALADDEGDERPEPAFLCRFWLRRHQGPSASAWRLTATQDVPVAAGRHHPARMRSRRPGHRPSASAEARPGALLLLPVALPCVGRARKELGPLGMRIEIRNLPASAALSLMARRHRPAVSSPRR